jgi:hypothetical protein
MRTYVHHPWTRANLNKLIGRIEGQGGVRKVSSSDGHNPLDTWLIPQLATISQASPAVANQSTFAQPAVASRSLSELNCGHRAVATAHLRGGHSHLLVVEQITIPAEIVISFVKTKFLLVDFPVLDNSACCCWTNDGSCDGKLLSHAQRKKKSKHSC